MIARSPSTISEESNEAEEINENMDILQPALHSRLTATDSNISCGSINNDLITATSIDNKSDNNLFNNFNNSRTDKSERHR